MTSATGYEVQLSPASDFSSEVKTFPAKSPQLVLPSAPAGTEMYWRVLAVAAGGGGPSALTCGPWSAAWSFTAATG